jgi:type VI secretion system secreted protein VgrG
MASVVTVPPVNPHYLAPQGKPELAQVFANKDPKNLGRVRVRYYWPYKEDKKKQKYTGTDWLRVLTPYSGDGKGQLFTPEIDSQVLIGYQNGLAEQPYVQGNLFHAKNKANVEYVHNGEVKSIQTRGGNKITFHDKKGGEKILISNGQQKETAMEIIFKGDGRIELKTKGDISLKAGNNMTLEAGGTLKMKAKKVVAEANSTVDVHSKSEIKVEGTTVKIQGKTTDIKGLNINAS